MNISRKELKDIIKTMKAKELRIFIERACVDHPEVFKDFMKFVHITPISIKDYIYELEKILNRPTDDIKKVSTRNDLLNDIEQLLMPQMEIHSIEQDYDWMMDAIFLSMPVLGREYFGKMENRLIQIHDYLMYMHETIMTNFDEDERLDYMSKFLSIASTCNEITETYILSHVKVLMDSIDSPDDVYDDMKHLLQNLPDGMSDRRIVAVIVVMIKLQPYIRQEDKELNQLLANFDQYEVVQEHLGILRLVE